MTRNRLVGHVVIVSVAGEAREVAPAIGQSCLVLSVGPAMPCPSWVPSCATVPKRNFLLRVLLREARQLLRRRLT